MIVVQSDRDAPAKYLVDGAIQTKIIKTHLHPVKNFNSV